MRSPAVEELDPGSAGNAALTSPDETRADVIRQFCERPGGEGMAELLMFLEEKEWARQAMIEELRSKIAED